MNHRPLPIVITGLLASACASIYPDHFYVLRPIPSSSQSNQNSAGLEVTVHVSIPSLVDRSQLVLKQEGSVVVLEHDRWASPLIDQITTILGQDIEQRRADVLITTQSAGAPRASRATIDVDIVEIDLPRSGQTVLLEARWQVRAREAPSMNGRTTFTATADGSLPSGYTAAVSQCIAALADQLVPLLGPISRDNSDSGS